MNILKGKIIVLFICHKLTYWLSLRVGVVECSLPTCSASHCFYLVSILIFQIYSQDYVFQDDMGDHSSVGYQLNPGKENGAITGGSNNTGGLDSSVFSQTLSRKKKSPLRMGKKVYEFYNAPITKFWAHAVSGCLSCPDDHFWFN